MNSVTAGTAAMTGERIEEQLNFMLISPCIVNQFLKMFQQDGTFVHYFIPCRQLYIFRVKHSPIIRSSNKL
jgi:hypothetical protein